MLTAVRTARRRAALLVLSLAIGLVAGCASASVPAVNAGGTPTLSLRVSGEPTPAPAASRNSAAVPVTLAFGGDVHFEGSSRQALTGGLRDITPLLARADLAMVNLETAVTTGGSPASGKEFVFRAPPSAFAVLARAGVDVVTMANNHGEDYGVQGLRDSVAAAAAAHFPVVGIGLDSDAAFAPHIAVVKGQRIAVIGATQVLDDNLQTLWTAGAGKPGLASAKDEQRLVAAVQQARASADTVVVDLHWGREQAACPLPRQQSLARALVAAGADVIVGSHAHVLLGGGFLGRAYVDYGLGNFVFYANGGAATSSPAAGRRPSSAAVCRTR